MSLVTVVYVPQGMVLSSDSRVIINTSSKINDVVERNTLILSDTVRKVRILGSRYGIAAYGQISIKNLPVMEHLDNFETLCMQFDTKLTQIPELLIEYFTKNFDDVATIFYLCGYQMENGQNIPYVYLVDIKQKLINRINLQNNNISYNVAWGGESEILNRLFSQIKVKVREDWQTLERANVYYEFIDLHQAIELSRYYIDMSARMFALQMKSNHVGGGIKTVVIPKHDAAYLVS